jgi:hypothetical protein
VYTSDLHVLQRPDTFWTNWAANPSGLYSPEDSDFPGKIASQRDYILSTVKERSAGLPVRYEDLSTSSLPDLVASYLARLEAIERDLRTNVVLLSGHWGEYGILRELGVETVYLIRDPFNSIVSHSKPIRHQKDYIRRGLTSLNSKDWIDNYLVGPHHYWIKHAEYALNHANATIIRYQHFSRDWQEVEGLPDITSEFEYKENNIAEILEPEFIDYIYDHTREICHALGFDEIYDRIRMSASGAQSS